jgi:hypothetical protein
MAGTKKYGTDNHISNLMGIPAHDYIAYAYADGTNPNSPTTIEYKLGGAAGVSVAIVVYTYDGSSEGTDPTGNDSGRVLTVERTA